MMALNTEIWTLLMAKRPNFSSSLWQTDKYIKYCVARNWKLGFVNPDHLNECALK